MQGSTIRLGKAVELPLDAATETFALLAKRGAGKTYAALKLAEGMLDAHIQVVAIDPVGKWWSLRLAADGKRPGFDIPVFGGHNGDLPLEPGAGKLLADLVVDRRVSCVLDVSTMRKADRKRFVTDFAEQLLLRKKRERGPSPLHLFLEESHMFVPQRTQRGEERMLGAFEDLVKLGRNYGIGATLISQRPQAVNKDVLTQTECLIVLQTVGAQERKALREWMREVGSDRSDVIDELPGLEVGEAYLWSPGWLREFKRVRIGKRKTFDASATPKVGAAKTAAAPRKLADDELEALRKTMADVVEEAEQNDPKALKREIAKLQRQVRTLEAKGPEVDSGALERARDEGVAVGREMVRTAINQADTHMGAVVGAIDRAVAELEKARSAAIAPIDVDLEQLPKRTLVVMPTRREAQRERIAPPTRSEGDPAIGGGCRRMLEVLASRYPAGFTIAQWATLAGLKKTGGTWSTYLSRLRKGGLVIQNDGLWKATEAGLAEAGEVPPAPSTPEETVEMWKGNLGGGAARMLDALFSQGEMTLDELAESVGITRSGGTFGTYLSKLRSNGLIEKDGGSVRVADVLG